MKHWAKYALFCFCVIPRGLNFHCTLAKFKILLWNWSFKWPLLWCSLPPQVEVRYCWLWVNVIRSMFKIWSWDRVGRVMGAAGGFGARPRCQYLTVALDRCWKDLSRCRVSNYYYFFVRNTTSCCCSEQNWQEANLIIMLKDCCWLSVATILRYIINMWSQWRVVAAENHHSKKIPLFDTA